MHIYVPITVALYTKLKVFAMCPELCRVVETINTQLNGKNEHPVETVSVHALLFFGQHKVVEFKWFKLATEITKVRRMSA